MYNATRAGLFSMLLKLQRRIKLCFSGLQAQIKAYITKIIINKGIKKKCHQLLKSEA
jgi:hypothetical protein